MVTQVDRLQSQLDEVGRAVEEQVPLAQAGLMAAALAHEYRNIFTPLLGYTQAAEARPHDGSLQRKAVQQARLSVERALSLLEPFLEAASPDRPAVAPEADLSDTLKAVLEAMPRSLQADRIQIQHASCVGQAAISPHHLHQVLLNLILNARQALRPGGGVIEVATLPQQDPSQRIKLVIADSGPGIAEADRKRIFTGRETTAPREQRTAEGSGYGLGLTVCRTLLHRAGGTIRLTDHPTLPGACFELALPAAPGPS
jgi:signal transduction histidine kinase